MPCHVRTILADNGSELTYRLFNKQKQASGEHEFDRLYVTLGIEHQLAKPRSPQTTGMAEPLSGRIRDVLATHHFESGKDLADTLELYALLYSQHLPQLALQHRTPLLAMKGIGNGKNSTPDYARNALVTVRNLTATQANFSIRYQLKEILIAGIYNILL